SMHPYYLFVLILFFLAVEWVGREEQYAIAKLGLSWPKPVRWAAYYALVFVIFYYAGSEKQFIYFQF
ncbi:MAG: MBOAT family protein, partial [Chitinophagales bacterium]|nr:MBOAT family protein [Chitinophagales bacterium]